MASHKQETSNPRVHFPYVGKRKMTVRGRQVRDGLFLASLIQHLDFTPPFEAIAITESTSADTASVGTTSTQRKRFRSQPEQHTLQSTLEPASNRSATRLPALPAQFSNLVPIVRIPDSGSGDGPQIDWHSLTQQQTLSTSLGQDRSSPAGRVILRTPPKTPEKPIDNEAFEQLYQALDILSSRLQIREIPVNNPLGLEGRFRQWTNPATGERIGCLVAEIHAPSKFFYLLEKELVSEACGPLILATRGRQAREAELNDLMETRQKGRTWPKTVPGWTLTHIRHNFGSPEGFAAGLWRAMKLPGTPSRP